MHYESFASYFVQSKLELICLIGWIYIYKNKIRSRSSKLRESPFIVIWGVYSNAISWLQSQRNQAS